MFINTKILGTPFDKPIDHATVKIESEEMYICTLGVNSTNLDSNLNKLIDKAYSDSFLNNDHPVVFSIHRDDVLLMDGHKYYIQLMYGFYHLILDTVLSIFYIQENDPDAVFVINASVFITSELNQKKSIDFVVDVLRMNNIKFHIVLGSRVYPKETVPTEAPAFLDEFNKPPVPHIEIPIYKLRNCTVVDKDFCRILSFSDITYMYEKYLLSPIRSRVGSSNKKLKLYISRGGSNARGESFIEPDNPRGGYVNVDARIYEENLVESYIESLGFKVVSPYEQPDLSILDQVKLMMQADVLVGVTGTGLVNLLFMESGGTVIELISELGHEGKSSVTIPDYWYYSQSKGHTYIGLDLIDKQGTTAVEKLKSLLRALDLNKLN